MTTPKPLPTIARCACGRAAGIIRNGATRVLVGCFKLDCWRGPSRKTAHGAILAWNRMMSADGSRLTLCLRLLRVNRRGGIDAVLAEIDKIRRGE